jgi:sugar phosphate isomerase/epimerase
MSFRAQREIYEARTLPIPRPARDDKPPCHFDLKEKNMNNDLINLFWTTAGMFPDLNGFSRYDFRARVESAACAGFKGIGIWHTDLAHVLETRTLKEMKSILDDNGMKYLELEFLTDWFLEGEKKAVSDRWKHLLLEASQALDAHHIKMGDFNNTPCPMSRLIEAFAALCEEAQAYGAVIGFEFMASAVLHTLEDSLQMVEEAGAPNGGLSLDIVHVVNLGISYEAISRIPLERLVSVELNDGFPPGDPRQDPKGGRLFCGEGAYDIRGFIQSVQKTGYQGPWAVEVFSEQVAAMTLEEANRRAFKTTKAYFEG